MTKKNKKINHMCLSSEDENPAFSFSYVDENRFLLHKLDKQKVDSMIKLLKHLEKMTWAQITSNPKYFKIVDPKKMKYTWPKDIDIDHSVSELRASNGVRIFGFRVERTYHFVWFDGNHQVFAD